MQWLTGKSSSERKKKSKRFKPWHFFLQSKAYCVGPLFQVIYLVLSPSQAARSTIDPLDWNLSGTHTMCVTHDPPPQKESDQQTNQEEGCVSGGFPQFRYIYVACLCWFRRITVPSCALRPSNYLWIIISSDNLPWMDTRTKIFLHKIDLTLSPPDPDYRLCINYYYYNFPPDFSATFDDGGFPQSAFLLSLSQTNKGRTNFQEIVHSIQI